MRPHVHLGTAMHYLTRGKVGFEPANAVLNATAARCRFSTRNKSAKGLLSTSGTTPQLAWDLSLSISTPPHGLANTIWKAMPDARNFRKRTSPHSSLKMFEDLSRVSSNLWFGVLVRLFATALPRISFGCIALKPLMYVFNAISKFEPASKT